MSQDNKPENMAQLVDKLVTQNQELEKRNMAMKAKLKDYGLNLPWKEGSENCPVEACRETFESERALGQHLPNHSVEKVAAVIREEEDGGRYKMLVEKHAGDEFISALNKKLGQEVEKEQEETEDIEPEEQDETSEIKQIISDMKPRQIEILGLFGEDYRSASEASENSDYSIHQVRISYDMLNGMGLLETRQGAGAKLTKKGKKVVQQAGIDVERAEEVPDEVEDSKIEELYEQDEVDVTDLNTKERIKLQQKFLEESEVSKSVNQTLEELYGKTDYNQSLRNMVFRAYDDNSEVEKHPSLSGRSKKFAISEKQQEKVKEKDAVKKAEDQWDKLIDGTSQYDWIKVAVGRLFPEEGEKTEITYDQFVAPKDKGGGGFPDHDGNTALDTWQDLVTRSALKNALKYELDATDTEFEWKSQGTNSNTDPRKAGHLVIDRRG